MFKWFEKKYNNILNIFLLLLAINLIIYIFLGSKALMNSDSAFIVDYSLEQLKTKSFFPKSWVNTNDFWVYSLIPLITIFIKLGFSLFLSRQFSVLIQTVLLFLILFDLYKKQLNDKKSFKIILLLLLSGISGQFIFEMFGDATYGSIIFYMVLELWLFIRYLNSSKKINCIFFGIILCLITACSVRFPIYIGAPIICCIFYFIYENGIEKKYIKIFIAVLIAILVGFILNKYLTSVLTITSATTINLINNEQAFDFSLNSIIFNYLWLCGATGLNVFSLTVSYNNDLITTSSPLVIISFIKFIYSIFTILLPFILLKKTKKMNDSEKIIYIFTCSLLVIILFFLLIGGMSSWYRYLTPVLFFLNLLYPLCYKYNFSKKKKNRIVFNLFMIMVVMSSLFLSITSYYDLKSLNFKQNNYDQLTDFLISKDLKYGYTLTGNEHNLYRLITNDKLQITRINDDGTKPFYWLNSKDWFKKDYYKGKVFFIRKENQESIKLEEKAIKTYTYGEYEIFVFDSNDKIIDALEIE